MMMRFGKTLSCILILSTLFSCITAVNISAAMPESKNGVLDIEAEKTTFVNTHISAAEDKKLSGGKGLVISEEDKNIPPATAAADIDLSFKADQAGTYTIWLRSMANQENNSGNSIFISINGGDYAYAKIPGDPDVPMWGMIGTIKGVQAGSVATVKIKTRQRYQMALDRFIITNNAAYTPDDVALGISQKSTATPKPTVASKPVIFEAKDGLVKFEAEKVKILNNYTEITGADLSGGKGLNTRSGGNMTPAVTEPADLEFTFKADKTSAYALWVRVKPTTSNKSLAVSANQSAYKTVVLGGTPNEYFWVSIAKISGINAGDMVPIRILTTNGYFDIDNFLITNKTNATPTGVEGTLGSSIVAGPVLYPTPSALPPAGHPRVYFTKEDIPRILENAKKPQNASAWAKHESNLADSAVDTIKPLSGSAKSNNNSAVLGVIESRAFDYALRGNEAAGKKAITAMRSYIESVVFLPGDYDNIGQTVFTIGAVYDWCYPLLSTDDKEVLIGAVPSLASQMEIGWPPNKQSAVTSHGSEGQLQRDLMCAGIAMYDERPDIYLNVAGRFFKEYVPARKFMFAAHMNTQGDTYSNYRGQWDALSALVLDAIGVPQVFGADQQYSPYWILYARRPDGQVLRDGDSDRNNKAVGVYNAGYARTILHTGNYFNDPYLKWEGAREFPNLKIGTPSINQSINCVEFLIFNNPDLQGKSTSDLPLTKYFAAPKGGYIARTSWAEGFESPAVVAEMKINEVYFSNHQHLDAGSFQIYYKGALATDSGYYHATTNTATGTNDGGTAYGSIHDYNYNKRTIAHNTMLVYDPDEKFSYYGPRVNDGGQKIPNNGAEPTTLEQLLDPEKGYVVGKVLGQEFGQDPMAPNYTYLKGDLAKAYSDKITDYERSFMFLNLKDKDHPAAMLVFDRVVASNEKFKKSWLLHGLQEPTINGTQTVFKDTRSGYNGKLTVDTLLPKADNLTITPVGGPDKEFWVTDDNYYAIPAKGGSNEGGGWRIEVSPKNPSKMDYFLNVLQVGDAASDKASLPVTVIETEKVAGARIADRVVIFGKSKERTKNTVEFEFTGDGEFEITVADLEKGTWQIAKDGAALTKASATAEGGVIVFQGSAGSYQLTYTDASVDRPVLEGVKPQNEGIGIRVSNKLIYTDVPPVTRNDRTLVPMRAIFEKLGVDVAFDEATSTATATKDDRVVKITQDSTTAYIDGEAIQLDVPATIINDRFLVPVRFVSEAFNAKVGWDEFAKIVDVFPGAVIPKNIEVPKGYARVINSNASAESDVFYATNTWDNSYDTLWSAEGECEIVYELDQEYTISATEIMFNPNAGRDAVFEIQYSTDGKNFTSIYQGKGDGKTPDKTFENFPFAQPVKAKYIKYIAKGSNISMWNGVKEIRFKTN